MSTIVTRASKGSALTWAEGDANITNLNNDKMESFTVAGDSGSTQTISDNNTLTISGGTGLSSVASATDTITINLDNTTVSAGSYTLASITVDAQGRITSASNGSVDIVNDTTPQLGGPLDVNGQKIINGSTNGNIQLEPNGTGDVYLTSDTVYFGDLNSSAFITTFGTGSLSISTNDNTNSGTIVINQGANANISITPNGTGGTVVKNLEYQEFVHSLGTTSGTIAPNATNGNIQTITLNGNLTVNGFTSPVSGQTVTLIINTGGTGRTLTSTMLFAGGSKTLSTTNTTDILTISYIGTTYYASLVKGYA